MRKRDRSEAITASHRRAGDSLATDKSGLRRQKRRVGAPRTALRRRARRLRVCAVCDAVQIDGRWGWHDSDVYADARQTICPACERTGSGEAGGHVEIDKRDLDGLALEALLAQVHATVRRARLEHPMHRVIDVQLAAADAVQIAVTEPQLARSIGDALLESAGGELALDYRDHGTYLRVRWRRQPGRA